MMKSYFWNAFGILICQNILAANIRISRVDHLIFDPAAQGDPSATISAGTSKAARFLVRGDPNRKYEITLPAGSINMLLGSNTIAVGTFQSQPSLTGQLDESGREYLSVGATRNALSLSQVVGDYTGTFTVRVQYLSDSRVVQASADARQKVIATINIQKVADLDFGEFIQGDPSRTIASTAPQSAKFVVSGERYKTYSVQLPASAVLQYSSATLNVQSFTSTPSGSGNLGTLGKETLSVGATISNIPQNQLPGTYNGQFSVTVVYQ